jgi:hypothetical protein
MNAVWSPHQVFNVTTTGRMTVAKFGSFDLDFSRRSSYTLVIEVRDPFDLFCTAVVAVRRRRAQALLRRSVFDNGVC